MVLLAGRQRPRLGDEGNVGFLPAGLLCCPVGREGLRSGPVGAMKLPHAAGEAPVETQVSSERSPQPIHPHVPHTAPVPEPCPLVPGVPFPIPITLSPSPTPPHCPFLFPGPIGALHCLQPSPNFSSHKAQNFNNSNASPLPHVCYEGSTPQELLAAGSPGWLGSAKPPACSPGSNTCCCDPSSDCHGSQQGARAMVSYGKALLPRKIEI